ncbi:hypothetical protein SNE40_005145 [Patella caerulea]|uniref:Uncharacterized protein n=1 Tax=Patella caerulea TaxID=87958 RepID=A0AAN8KBE0_PATCE
MDTDFKQEGTAKENGVKTDIGLSKVVAKCENPDLLIETIDSWNNEHQKLVNAFKTLQGKMEVMTHEKEKKDQSNSSLINETEDFLESVKNSQPLLQRINNLDEENERLKENVSKLQYQVENLKKEKSEFEEETHKGIMKQEKIHQDEVKYLKDLFNLEAHQNEMSTKEKINKYEKEIQDLQQKNNQLQASKEAELTHLSMEYENQLAKIHRQKLQNQQNQSNSGNQEIFRKKLQHMKEEYEGEIRRLKQALDLENSEQTSCNPSPRTCDRLSLTAGTKRRR